MNIGIIGVPGSGKSKLAEALAERMEPKSYWIIDGYVPALERRLDVAFGMSADYLSNTMVALERWALEQAARREHDLVITCGTLIETAVYVAMDFTAMINTFSEEEKMEAGPRIDAVLRMLSVLYNDCVRYDHAFYLPPTTPGPDEQFMDTQLQAGLAGFKVVPVTPLRDSASVDEALEALSAVQAG